MKKIGDGALHADREAWRKEGWDAALQEVLMVMERLQDRDGCTMAVCWADLWQEIDRLLQRKEVDDA